jgi:hypothetical protein
LPYYGYVFPVSESEEKNDGKIEENRRCGANLNKLLFLVVLIALLMLAPTLSFAQFNLKLPGLNMNNPMQVPPMWQQPAYTIQSNASSATSSLLPKSLTDSIINQAKKLSRR